MPVSECVYDHTVRTMIELVAPQSVIDVGPGKGKYGRMLCEIEKNFSRPIHKTCVEIDKEKIIKRFGLATIYDEIINMDAASLPKARQKLTADLVIIADMIEHLTKSEGIDLLEYFQYRAKHIILVIPIDWVSLDYKDYDHEAHISIWQKHDIQRFRGGFCVERKGDKGNRFLLAVLNHITCPPNDFFVVRDPNAGAEIASGEENLEFGYLIGGSGPEQRTDGIK